MASLTSPSASGHVLPASTTSHASNSSLRSRMMPATLSAPSRCGRLHRRFAVLVEKGVGVFDGSGGQCGGRFVMPADDFRWLRGVGAVQEVAGFVARAGDPQFVFLAEFLANLFERGLGGSLLLRRGEIGNRLH